MSWPNNTENPRASDRAVRKKRPSNGGKLPRIRGVVQRSATHRKEPSSGGMRTEVHPARSPASGASFNLNFWLEQRRES